MEQQMNKLKKANHEHTASDTPVPDIVVAQDAAKTALY